MIQNPFDSPIKPGLKSAALGEPAMRTPPVLIDAPPPSPGGRQVCGGLDIRIDCNGIWYYHGSPIQRKEMVCLFASALTRDIEGGYWLATPDELVPVEVEDAAFMGVEMFVGGAGRQQKISFRTNVDEIVTVDGDRRISVAIDPNTQEPSPYVTLPRRLSARLTRAVYYAMVAISEQRVVDGIATVGVWSSGIFFPVGRVTDD